MLSVYFVARLCELSCSDYTAFPQVIRLGRARTSVISTQVHSYGAI